MLASSKHNRPAISEVHGLGGLTHAEGRHTMAGHVGPRACQGLAEGDATQHGSVSRLAVLAIKAVPS
jgi:hypothetical protein